MGGTLLGSAAELWDFLPLATMKGAEISFWVTIMPGRDTVTGSEAQTEHEPAWCNNPL